MIATNSDCTISYCNGILQMFKISLVWCFLEEDSEFSFIIQDLYFVRVLLYSGLTMDVFCLCCTLVEGLNTLCSILLILRTSFYFTDRLMDCGPLSQHSMLFFWNCYSPPVFHCQKIPPANHSIT